MTKRYVKPPSNVNHQLLINAEVGEIFEGFNSGTTDPDQAYDRLVSLAKNDAHGLVKILIKKLRSSDAITSKVATWSLQSLGLREAIDPLTALTEDTKASDFARVAAMSLLQEMDIDVDQQLVLSTLRDPYAMMEQFTKDFIDLVLDPRVNVEDILDEFLDFNVEMQMEYIQILSRRREPRVALFLWYLEHSSKDEIQDAARLTLKKLRMAGVMFSDPADLLRDAKLTQAVAFCTRIEGMINLHLAWDLGDEVELAFFTIDYHKKGVAEFYHGRLSLADYSRQFEEYLRVEGLPHEMLTLHEARVLLADGIAVGRRHRRRPPFCYQFDWLLTDPVEYSDDEVRSLSRRLMHGNLGPKRLAQVWTKALVAQDYGLVWDLHTPGRSAFTRDGFIRHMRKLQSQSKLKWQGFSLQAAQSRRMTADVKLTVEFRKQQQPCSGLIELRLRREQGQWGIEHVVTGDAELPTLT